MEPIKSGSFTYSHPGGLLNSGVPRADRKTLNAHLNPVRPPRKQTWMPPKLTGKWCKAQLAHYGIKPLSGSKQELEARLREAFNDGLLKKQPLEMKLLEKYMRAEWRAKKESGDHHQSSGGYGKHGCASYNPNQSQSQYQYATGKVIEDDIDEKDHTIIIKSEPGGRLATCSTTATSSTPSTATSSSSSSSCAKGPKRRPGSPAFTKKHVFGTWDVTCPDIQRRWENFEELTLTLFQDLDSLSVVGELDLGVLDGFLKLKSYPSAKHPTTSFTWVGTTTGAAATDRDEEEEEEEEKEVQRGQGEIVFFDRGLKAKGWFDAIGDVGRNVRFEATKIAETPAAGRADFDMYNAPTTLEVDDDDDEDDDGYGRWR